MQFLDTNLTVDQYILGLTKSTANLPSVLAEWEETDVELTDVYTSQLNKMLEWLPEAYNTYPEHQHKLKQLWKSICWNLFMHYELDIIPDWVVNKVNMVLKSERCLDTNMTVDEFVMSITKCAHGLPKLKDDWNHLEDDLAEEYWSQLEWMAETGVQVADTYPYVKEIVNKGVTEILYFMMQTTLTE